MSEDRLSWRSLSGGGHFSRIAILCFGVWLHAANSMLAATTMPRAVEEIGGVLLIGWTFTLYQLGSILAGAATGLSVVRFGLRLAFLIAAGIYGVGSMVCALAPDMEVMLAGRLLQGVGGGWLVALVYVALERLFPHRLMPRLIALISAVWSASAFCGPLIGGSFASIGHWRAAFWAFALQAALFMLAAGLTIAKERREAPASRPRVPVGRLAVLAGAILLVAAAGAEARLASSSLLCLGGLALLWLFLRLDGADPRVRMFPSQPFDPRRPLGAGLVMVFALSLASMSFLVYGPFLLDVLYGVSPLAAGYMVALESVSWGVAAMIFAGAREVSEKHLIRVGAALVTLGILGFASTMPTGPLWTILGWAVCQGAGFGMMWGFVVRRVLAAAPGEERGRASSALPTTQQIGFAIGAAAAGLVANAAGFSDGIDPASAAAVGFWVFAAFLPIALIGNLAAWRLAE